MKENEVFWLGKRSRTGEEHKNFADEPEFAAAMQDACTGYGCKVQRFVSAKGVYGTWLLEFERGGTNQRIVWNGKDEKMVLQVMLARGGWEEPKETTIDETDIPGFIDGIRELVGRDGEADE